MKKMCNKCEIEKDLNSFPKRKSSKDGHRNECFECKKIYYLSYYEDNKSLLKQKESNSLPCCSNCNFMKSQFSLEAFLNQVSKIYKHQQANHGD